MTNLKAQAAELQAKGRNGDTMLAHINPQEAALLKSLGGSGTINPDTGLPEFFFKSVAKAVAGPVIGGLFGRSASNQAAGAARAAGGDQLAAAQLAAEAQRFKPYAVTTGFGRSFFDEDKQTAGYEIDPRLAGFRDTNYDLSRGVYDQLGAADPQAAAAQYLSEQMGLLQPQRMAEDIALRNQQLGRGRIGLGLSGEAAGAGMGGMVNPEQFQLQAARALADAQMAAGAREMGQADIDRLIGRASGLFSQGAGIEQLALTPLTLGSEMGGRAASAGANVGQSLLAGGQGAAQANLAAGLSRANFTQSLGNTIGGMNFGGLFNNMGTANRYGTNLGSQQTNMLAAQERGFF